MNQNDPTKACDCLPHWFRQWTGICLARSRVTNQLMCAGCYDEGKITEIQMKPKVLGYAIGSICNQDKSQVHMSVIAFCDKCEKEFAQVDENYKGDCRFFKFSVVFKKALFLSDDAYKQATCAKLMLQTEDLPDAEVCANPHCKARQNRQSGPFSVIKHDRTKDDPEVFYCCKRCLGEHRLILDRQGMKRCSNSMCSVVETKATGEFKFCGRCGKAQYCGKECQVEHWKKEHRAQCVPKK